jgi:predicted O-methyltransferase YrrM
MYQNPEIESSYRKNDLGKTLYDQVIEHRPKIIVEFGCLYGYSTVAMAMALRDLGEGKIISYDLWESYPFKHSTRDETVKNISKYELQDWVEFKQMSYYEWLENPTQFDLLHLDISNDGDTILITKKALHNRLNNGSKILFEGGSVERDEIEWMKEYNKVPFNSIKERAGYTVIDNRFPSISMLNN